MSPEAQCRLAKYSVKTDIEHDDDHDADAEHKHEKDTHHGKGEDHDQDHHDDNDQAHHDENDQEHHDDHDQDHHDENGDEHARHSEFHSEYRFVCKNPGKLSQMDVMLIQSFPSIEHIEVQLLTETKQTALELTVQSHGIRF